MTAGADLTDPVARARLAIAVLAVAREAVGGLWLRARPSPAREAVLAALDAHLPEAARVGPETDDLALVGGTDVGASLAAGRRVVSPGLLDAGGRLTLTSAERASPALSVRIGQALDRGGRCLVALDEGVDAEEGLSSVLAGRASLFVDLGGLGLREATALAGPLDGLGRARKTWREVAFSADLETDLAGFTLALQVGEARHALATRAAARVVAALDGRDTVGRADIEAAAALILVPRGRMPEIQPEVETGEQAASPSEARDDHDTSTSEAVPEDLLTGSTAVPLPSALLELSGTARARGARGTGAGMTKRGTTRGRPLPSRPGHAGSRARIDPVATLRAAVPWQRLRPPAPRGQPIALRTSDIRIRRFEERSDRVVIFTVDASGSQAMARMAEAKGAVECLLGEAYRRRDQVAMVAFRDREAEVLLAPTRALVRARNALVGLPAGGATPLASGLSAASALASRAIAGGATPIVVLLSDGRGNIALDGTADRARANDDADNVARTMTRAGVECLVLDTGTRPGPRLQGLAGLLGARYIAMPHAGAREMSAAVNAALSV